MDQSRGVPDGTESDPPSTSASNTNTTPASSNTVVNPLTTWWKPNDMLLVNLTSMGFSPVMAKKALYYTNNESAEAAIDWIFSNGNDSDLPLEIELQQRKNTQQSTATTITTKTQSYSSSGLVQVGDDSDDDLYKMVFVVNSELSMGVGKIAAQVAHAALGLHRLLLQHQSKYGEPLLNWTEYGETKIVLRGESTSHLVELEHKAIGLDLPCYMVHDAGKTQVKSGSTTVLGIFGSNKLVDQVTSQLKLY